LCTIVGGMMELYREAYNPDNGVSHVWGDSRLMLIEVGSISHLCTIPLNARPREGDIIKLSEYYSVQVVLDEGYEVFVQEVL